MKRQNKKGFTIVELVIVIAVIAILAAVLIPTFSSVIKKAKISADTQVVRNMNTTLSVDEVVNGTPEDFKAVIKALKEDGYVISNLNPTTNGWFYVWESTTNQILLVDETYAVRFASEEGYPALGNTWYFAVSNETVADKVAADCPTANVVKTKSNIQDLNSALNKGGEQTLYVDESINFNGTPIDVTKGEITLELGDSSITNTEKLRGIPVAVNGEGVILNLNGGKLSNDGSTDSASDGKQIKVGIRASDKATLNVNGLNLSMFTSEQELASSFEGGVGISVYGGSKANLNNVSAALLNGSFVGVYGGNSEVVLTDCESVITSNPDGYANFFFGNPGEAGGTSAIKVESGSYTGYWLSVFNNGYNKLTINGGDFVFVNHTTKTDGITLGGTNNVEYFDIHASAKSVEIVISGGTFQGVNWYDITDAQWGDLIRLRNRSDGKVLDVQRVGTGASSVITITLA